MCLLIQVEGRLTTTFLQKDKLPDAPGSDGTRVGRIAPTKSAQRPTAGVEEGVCLWLSRFQCW